MKIVILDGFALQPGDLSWEKFEALGELTVYDRSPADTVSTRIGDAPYVYTNKTPVTSEIMDNCPQMKFIGVLATGYNIVDVKAAKERGITVCNIPTYGTASVAQFVFSLLLEICNHVGLHNDAVHNDEWTNCQDFSFWKTPLMELAGKTMGLVGFGRIGQATARIALAMGMNVIYSDISAQPMEFCRLVPLTELLSESDIISLHCPLLDSTAGIICKDNIQKMKDGVIIINTARGGLVVEQDMAEALNSGKIYAAATDVVSTEPITSDNPLLNAKNMIITPHIAWAPTEARIRLMNIAANNLEMFIKGTPINLVEI